MRACANANTRQSLHCQHTQLLGEDKDLDQTLDVNSYRIRQLGRLKMM